MTQFLNKNATGARGSFDSIRRAKEDERIEKKDRIRIFIEDALKHADIYVNGDKANISSREASTRINEALGKLVAMQYSKLTYMETAPELSDTAAIFNEGSGQITFIGIEDKTPNKLALEEVVNLISLNNQRHIKTSLKALQDKFGIAPYGFDPKDVQWLVAMLFKMGRVAMTFNSQSLSLISNTKDELIRYITKRDYVEKLLIDIRERATDGQIRSVKEVLKDYFGMSVSSDDDDVIMKNSKSYASNKVKAFNDVMIEYRVNPKLPSKSLMEKAKKNLDEVVVINEPVEFFKTVDQKKNDLLDDAEDTAPVFDFFNGEQKTIFEKTLKYINIFENSKTYVSNQEILAVVEQMTSIANDRNPYSSIQKLPALNDKFMNLYGKLLEKEAAQMEPIVADDYKKVMGILETKPFADVLYSKFVDVFEELKIKLGTSNEIAGVKNIKLESDTLKIRCLDEIAEYERRQQPVVPILPTPSVGPGGNIVDPPVQPQKKRKNVSISNVAGARTYSLESEADIDKFLAEMKQKLMNELDVNTIITLS